jgi:hypothetical protein
MIQSDRDAHMSRQIHHHFTHGATAAGRGGERMGGGGEYVGSGVPCINISRKSHANLTFFFDFQSLELFLGIDFVFVTLS